MCIFGLCSEDTQNAVFNSRKRGCAKSCVPRKANTETGIKTIDFVFAILANQRGEMGRTDYQPNEVATSDASDTCLSLAFINSIIEGCSWYLGTDETTTTRVIGKYERFIRLIIISNLSQFDKSEST
jgi:hypothetical protein